jgi:putative transposase
VAGVRQAYGAGDAARAKRLLGNLARRLRNDHPSAAESLEEGLDETLTVMRLGLPAESAAGSLDYKRESRT